jgi:Galactose oxidase, central domain
MSSKGLILAAALLAGTSLGAVAGTVAQLRNNLPFDGVNHGFLLTDGSILFQGGLLQDFYRFKPDSKGSYVNGTYFPAAALPSNYIPYATSGGVLPDGRVLLIGGEYTLLSNNTLTFAFTNQMAVYDPKADKWTMVAPPSGPDRGFVGDSPCSGRSLPRLWPSLIPRLWPGPMSPATPRMMSSPRKALPCCRTDRS